MPNGLFPPFTKALYEQNGDGNILVTDGDRTFWQWESRFDTRAGEAHAMSTLVGEQIYEAGFAAIREHMGLA